MSVTLHIGPPASGKTRIILEALRAPSGERRIQERWVVLPDFFQVTATRRRLAAQGGALGVRIGTFRDLFQEILTLAGKPVPLASKPTLDRLLRAEISRLVEAGQLEHFSGIAHTPGFIQTLRERIAELKRAQVDPEAFLGDAGSADPGQQEIGRIYQAYQARLQGLDWADREGLNWLAVEALEAHGELGWSWPLLAVDGFDNFNPAQLAALALLGDRVESLILTLPGEASGRRAHRRFHRALRDLQGALPDLDIQYGEGGAHLPPPLKGLERGLFEPEVSPTEARDAIHFIEARSPREEAREALRWLKARHLREGIPLESCALVTPTPEAHQPLLKEAAAEFGMPLRFAHGEPLITASSIVALLDLLDMVLHSWPRRLTLDAVRSPFFDLSPFGLTPEQVSQLDDVSRYGQVIEGLDQWREALDRLAEARGPKELDLEEDVRLPSLPNGEQARALQQGLSALAERLQPPASATTHDWVRWLEDLLDDLRYIQGHEQPGEVAAAHGLREALRALVLAERVSGPVESAFEAFISDLRAVLEGSSLEQPIDWRQPRVLVLPVLAARGLRFEAVAVLGLSEGLFPEAEREDPFLSEAVRQRWGLEPRLGREQGGLFYQAVTRADQRLLLTRPYLAEDGEYWEPSPFWEVARDLVEGAVERVQPEAPRPLSAAASPEELLFWSVRRGSLPSGVNERLLARWRSLQGRAEVLQARVRVQPAGPFEGDLSALEDRLAEAYGPDHLWSSSRLETYGTCPHFFLAANGLRLERREPLELGLDAAQLGSMLHGILEGAYPRAVDPADPDQVIEALQVVAKEVFETAPEIYGFRPTPLYELRCKEWLEALEETVRELAKEGSGWNPAAHEARFGLGGEPPLVIDTAAGRVRLRGVIDRVDRREDGALRIVDYKTGSSHLAPKDLDDGRRLQLPLYALGAREALGMGEPVEGFYWVILGAKRGTLRLSRYKTEVEGGEIRGPGAAYRVARSHLGRIVSGIRTGEFPPIPPRGGCPSYCPAAAWCWRYEETRHR